MSEYSTSLRTQYLNPRTHIKNRQTEFRLDKQTMYQSNLRLLNFGCKKIGGAGNYNNGAGVLSLIKNIRLMDGSRELSSLRHAPDYLTFKNINSTNEKVQNIHDVLHKSRGAKQLLDDGAVHGSILASNVIIADVFDEKQLGYVDLRLVLPLLSELPALDTSVFKNLRLVIEYSNLAHYGSDDKSDVLEVNEPVLACDEIVGEKKAAAMKSAMKSFVWSEIEHDLFQVPTGAQPAAALGEEVQEVNAVINGFDNKYVSRVLMVKSYNDKTLNYATNNALGNGNCVSLAMFKDELNVRHKGSNMFNGDALKNAGFRQMLLQETWGEVCVPPFGALTEVGLDVDSTLPQNVNGVSLTPGNGGARRKNALIGQYDYIGFQVEDQVKQLQVNYKRTCVLDTAASLDNSVALDVHLYAEVRKQLVFSGGNYQISYV